MLPYEYPPMIVMGVSGSGKSTIGEALGETLDIPFLDGDDLHPDSNKNKMREGIPLTDEDRIPWLHRIGELIDAGRVEGHPTIVACSALKRAYRDVLRRHAPNLIFLHLAGARELIEERLSLRSHEYMPSTLLSSQFATLEAVEPGERAVVVDIGMPPEAIVATILAELPVLASH